jgi:mono/diheme cytochrome c family protein
MRRAPDQPNQKKGLPMRDLCPWLAMAALAAAVIAAGSPIQAQVADPSLADARRFTSNDGAYLYRATCQGCHMADGKGATGAGTYPSLFRNEKLEAGGYPVFLVVNGQKAMPGFGALMNDEQVAAVVNYVRSNFGNAYKDKVTAEDVKAVRQ